jgi:phage gpG-like protein
MIDIKWDFRKFNRSLDSIGRESKPISLTAMRRATEYVRGYIVKNKLSGQVLKRRTGRLAGSITSAQKIEGQDVVGMVGSNLKYARIHELGGVIRPKNFKFLHFVVNGQEIFAKKVTIPKRPYIWSSIEETSSKIANIFGTEFFAEIKSKVATR